MTPSATCLKGHVKNVVHLRAWFPPRNAKALQEGGRVTFHFWALQEDGTPHKVTLSLAFFQVPPFLPYWHQVSYFHACRGQICQFQFVPVRSSCLIDRVLVLTHPFLINIFYLSVVRGKLEVSTPCLRTKSKGTFSNPHFPRQSVNCCGQDNRGWCEYRLKEKSRPYWHQEGYFHVPSEQGPQIEGSGKVYEGKHQLENELKAAPLQARRAEHFKHRWPLLQEHLFVPHVFKGTCYEAS